MFKPRAPVSLKMANKGFNQLLVVSRYRHTFSTCPINKVFTRPYVSTSGFCFVASSENFASVAFQQATLRARSNLVDP